LLGYYIETFVQPAENRHYKNNLSNRELSKNINDR